MKSVVGIAFIVIASLGGSAEARHLRILGGRDFGGAGDRLSPQRNSAWFPGEGEFSYCLEVSPDFGVTESVARQTVEAVFANWQNYKQAKMITSPTRHARYVAACDGNEDLKFYLGATNDKVEILKSQYENPVAFAEKTTYDTKTGGGRGLVWVLSASEGADWQLPGRLFGILSHEIGHTLGCDHVDGTIMTADIYDFLFDGKPHSNDFYRNVDFRAELVQCVKCAHQEFLGDLGSRPADAAPLFARLAGRKLEPPLTAALVRRVTALTDGKWAVNLDLTLKDAKGEVKIPLAVREAVQRTAMVELDAALFKTVIFKGPDITAGSEYRTFIGNWLGTMNDAGGKTWPVSFEYNLGATASSFLEIKYFDAADALFKVLYRSHGPE